MDWIQLTLQIIVILLVWLLGCGIAAHIRDKSRYNKWIDVCSAVTTFHDGAAMLYSNIQSLNTEMAHLKAACLGELIRKDAEMNALRATFEKQITLAEEGFAAELGNMDVALSACENSCIYHQDKFDKLNEEYGKIVSECNALKQEKEMATKTAAKPVAKTVAKKVVPAKGKPVAKKAPAKKK